MEHYVDIPVPGGGGPSSGLQGFLLWTEFNSVDLPPRNVDISERRSVEQIVDPVSSVRQRLHGFSLQLTRFMLLLTLQLVLKNALMSLVKGFFALFTKILKKVRSWLRTRGRHCSPSRAHPRRLLSWRTRVECRDSVEWVVAQRNDNSGKPYCWNRRTLSAVWKPPPGVKVVWVGERNEERRGLALAQGHACLHV